MNRARLWGIARSGVAPPAFMAAVIALVYSRVLFMGQVLYLDDIERAYVPWFAFLLRELRAGNWFPWSVDLGCGFPLWANMQSGAFYLPNLLLLIPASLTWTLGLLFALHYFWAALGAYLLARRFRIGTLGAVVAGLTYSLTGFMMAHQVHYPMVCSASWMPWFALGLLLWARERSPLGLALASVSLASSWLNYPHMALLVIAFGVACLGVELLVARQGGREAAQGAPAALALALVPIAVGTLLAGVALWPGYELVRAGCGDARRGYEFMTFMSLAPENLARFLVPNLFGGAVDFVPPARAVDANYWETSGYVGGICLLAVVAVGGRMRQQARWLYWALVAVALLALVLALGRYTPLLYRVLAHIPVLDRFRVPARWLLVWSGSMALLGGLAVHQFAAVLRHPVAARRALWLFASVAVCGGVLGALILREAGRTGGDAGALVSAMRAHPSWNVPEAGRDLAWLGICSAMVTWSVWMARRRRVDAEWAARLLAVVIIMQAYVFATDYTAVAPPDWYHLPSKVRALLPAGIAEGRMARFTDRGTPSGLRMTVANASLLFGIPSVHVYDPLSPPVAALRRQLGERLVRDPAVAAAFGASVIVTDRPPSALPPSAVPIARVRSTGSDRVGYVYRNAQYRGLAWTVSRTTPEALARQRIEDPQGAVGFLLDAPPISPEPQWQRSGLGGGPPRTVEVAEWSARRIAVRVAAGPPCSLVMASSRLPGWSATIDGAPVPLATANGVFCAAELPAAECLVELRYRPSGLGIGLGLTIGGLLLGLIAALVARRPGSVAA